MKKKKRSFLVVGLSDTCQDSVLFYFQGCVRSCFFPSNKMVLPHDWFWLMKHKQKCQKKKKKTPPRNALWYLWAKAFNSHRLFSVAARWCHRRWNLIRLGPREALMTRDSSILPWRCSMNKNWNFIVLSTELWALRVVYYHNELMDRTLELLRVCNTVIFRMGL